MAFTLAEGNKYSTTKLQAATIDYLRKEDPILERLKFKEIVGNSLTYNAVTTAAAAGFYAVGDTWTEGTHVVTASTAALAILGGDADVDEFLKKTRSNIIDLEAEIIEQKAEAVRAKYLDTFFYGDDTVDAKSFDGLHLLMTSTTYNTVHAGSGTGTALSLAKLDAALDLIMRPFKPDIIISTKAMRRGVETYLRSIGSAFPTSRDKFGIPINMYRDIPRVVSERLLDTETAASGAYSAATGGANTSIFVLSFNPLGLSGIQSGNMQTDRIGKLESKDAHRIRMKWYCGLMLQHLRSCSQVDGIIAASAVTA